MNERALANRLRISVIDQVGTVDLPGFLFNQIDQNLMELNYFKLSNLYNNLDTYVDYLKEIQEAYVDFVRIHNPIMKHDHLEDKQYEAYMTHSLYSSGYQFFFAKNELIKLENLFSVNCILKMKEFINRRSLQNKKIQKNSIA